MLNKNITGASYHYGGSFPMSSEKKNDSTSLIGELHDYKNIFILDSSILPNVPASQQQLMYVLIQKELLTKLINLEDYNFEYFNFRIKKFYW